MNLGHIQHGDIWNISKQEFSGELAIWPWFKVAHNIYVDISATKEKTFIM